MSLQLHTDKQLIDSYLSGSHASFEILINRHKNRVFSFILMKVKDKHLAEDIFQDTFIKVVNCLRSGSYQEQGKFLPWVLRIAHNLTMDHFRISKLYAHIHSHEDYEIFDYLFDKDQTVEEKMVNEQIRNNVKMLLEYLPPDQKEVIIMRHYYEMSFSEISEELDISINTILGRMRYGLKNLRKIINKKQLIMSP